MDVKTDAPTRSNSHEDKIWNRLTFREIEIGGIGPLTEGVLIVEYIALALRAWTNCDESVTGGVYPVTLSNTAATPWSKNQLVR